jgi:hypothetical protein
MTPDDYNDRLSWLYGGTGLVPPEPALK